MYIDYLLSAIPLLPLLLALLMPLLGNRSLLIPLTMTGVPVFIILCAFIIPLNSSMHIPWLLTSVYWQMDEIARLYLIFSSVIWLVASLYVAFARDPVMQRTIYRSLFLLAMAGNMLLIVSADMISFYLGFALMGLSAYGIIVKPSQRARRAARIYLGFTLIGELALFIAMLILFSASGSMLFIELQQQAIPDLAVALLVLGFGIKLALPGLHPWLPLTYTSAPLISVAVLSGPMMKAGLLGWIRFLPAGAENLQTWGGVLVWVGVAGLVFGTALALMQHRASPILAYSSVAKMALVCSLFGYALLHPEQADVVIAALVLFAMHHLLIKSALFIGLYNYQHRKYHGWLLTGMALLAISLAALPLSGGSAAKNALDMATEGKLGLLLISSGFATALMMLHFLSSLKQQTGLRKHEALSSAPVIAWWMLLPIAWLGPFMPESMAFDGKSLLIFIFAAGLFLYIRNSWSKPARQALIFQPGDIFHLFKRVRVVNPVIHKSDGDLSTLFDLPRPHSHPQDTNGLSLNVPGLLWFGVVILLIASLLLTTN